MAIQDVSKCSAFDLDALILPGGFGAAKNLSDFTIKGSDCQVDPSVAALIAGMLKARKPIGVICIAPVVLAKVAQSSGQKLQLTIGNDADTASALEKMGVAHRKAKVDEIVVDETHQIVSSPAYMYETKISEIAKGIEKLVTTVVSMA